MQSFVKRLCALLLALVLLLGLLPAGVLTITASAADAVEELDQPMAASTRPSIPVEVRSYDKASSQINGQVEETENAVDFTSLGGSFAKGDYLAFLNQEFGNGEDRTFLLNLSAGAAEAGKTIEVRLDSPTGEKLGEIALTDTKGPLIFKEHYITEFAPVTGVRDVYLVFPEATEVDLDFFLFSTYHFAPYAGTDNGRYYDTADLTILETPEEKDQRMAWFREARFGMFIHFGAYAYLAGRHILDDGTLSAPSASQTPPRASLAYKTPKEDFIAYAAAPFNPKDFDAEEIVGLAKAAGQKYITFTTRHHDGFSMYDTKIRNFRDFSITSLSNYGSFDRDPVMELAEECRKQGVHYCAYITLPDWYDPTMYGIWCETGKYNSTGDTGFNGETVEERGVNKADYLSRLKGQIREQIVEYGAEALWFDCGGLFSLSHEESYDLYHYCRSLNPNIIIDNRIFTDRAGNIRTMYQDFDTPERTGVAEKTDFDFEACDTINDHWGYNMVNDNWKSAKSMVEFLVQCAGFGGNFLLNIGPDNNGQVPEKGRETLLAMGEWLAVNGDSIYGTEPAFYETRELPDGVYATAREGKLYVHLTSKYTESSLTLDAMENDITGIRTLGGGKAADVYQVGGKLFFDLSGVTRDPYVTVLEVSVDGGLPQRKAAAAAPENLAKLLCDQGKVTFDGSSPTYRNSAESGRDSHDPNLTYGYKKALDGNTADASRWAAGDGNAATVDHPNPSYLTLNFAEPVTVNKAVVMAYNGGTAGTSGKGHNWVRGLKIEYWDGEAWAEAAGQSETFLAHKAENEFVFDTVTTTQIRLNLEDANRPAITEFQLYYDASLEAGSSVRILTPLDGAKIPAGVFSVEGSYTGKADSLELRLTAEELEAPIVLQGTLDASSGTWTAAVDPEICGLPWSAEHLSILAFLKQDGSITAVETVEVTYGGAMDLAAGLGEDAYFASSVYGDRVAEFGPHLAFNGVISDDPTAADNRWGSKNQTSDPVPWLMVDFGKTVSFNQAVIYEWKGNTSTGFASGKFAGYRAKVFKIFYDQGDDNWTLAYTGGSIGEKGVFMLPEPVSARRVKLELTEAAVPPANPSIREFELYLIPADVTALRAAYEKAMEEIGVDGLEDLYTAETLAAYLAAMETAKDILASNQAFSQRAVDEACRALLDAAAALTEAHVLTAVAAKVPTCTEAGNIAYWLCACGKYFADAEAVEEITLEETILPAAGHKTELRGKKAASCTETGYTGDLVCTVCGEVMERGETIPALGHDWSQWTETKTPTCTEPGEESRACARCGGTETRAAAAKGHVPELRGQKEPAAGEPGYTGDWYCAVCGVLLEKGQVIPADPKTPFIPNRPSVPVKPTPEVPDFSDVSDDDWFAEDVRYVLDNGLMSGTGSGQFSPNADMTRAMLVTILYRLEGETAVSGDLPFSDVTQDWYRDAVRWTAENEIVKGYADGRFGPNDPITREQLAAVLYRYAAYKGCDMITRSCLDGFADAASVSRYALVPMNWVVDNGLLNGSNDHLNPQATATRAQAAAILARFCEKLK